MGPRIAVLGGGTACEIRHWDLRLSILWGHEQLWSSAWCHEAMYWVGEKHASSATGIFVGAPCGVTKRARGVSNWMG
eukprot:8247378-Pyramimonas_sp.AAC.1